MLARLHRLKGSSGAFADPEGGAPRRVLPLEHHRLLLDAESRDERAGGTRPAYKLFEVVPGARVVGIAAPGALVTARLAVHGGTAGRFYWSAETTANADGRYAFTLPYANAGAATDVRPAPHYELRSGAARATLEVEESDVRDGAAIPGPALLPAGQSAAARSSAVTPRPIGSPTVAERGR
jgi:asparagine N-glycosylation enzyme membrane subunit Stt3